MMQTKNGLLAALLLLLVSSSHAKIIQFGGYTWTVRTGQGGPGPNVWNEDNVWLDSATNLHLKICQRGGKWSCAEITMQKRLGFGRYEFQTRGRFDLLDDNVVLGLFNYPTADVGPDGTHEIDIEFARWGSAANPNGNFTVWPAQPGLKHITKPFAFLLASDRSSHRFTWRRDQILFQSLQAQGNGDGRELSRWLYQPSEPTRSISQRAMPVHVNLWLFRGLPPKNGLEAEVILHAFRFTPE